MTLCCAVSSRGRRYVHYPTPCWSSRCFPKSHGRLLLSPLSRVCSLLAINLARANVCFCYSSCMLRACASYARFAVLKTLAHVYSLHTSVIPVTC